MEDTKMREKWQTILGGFYVFVGVVHMTFFLHFIQNEAQFLFSMCMSMLWPLTDLYYFWGWVLK